MSYLSVLDHVVSNGNEAHRFYALRALGRVQEGIPEWVLACLYDEDPDVRIEAAHALGELSANEYVDDLLACLRGDPDGEVKCEIIEACGKLKLQQSIPLLSEIVGCTGDDLPIPASEDDINESSIQWQEAYGTGWDERLDAQIKAIIALGELKASQSTEVIADAMLNEFNQDLSGVGCKALANMGEAGRVALIRCFEEGNKRLQRKAMETIGKHFSVPSKAFFEQQLDHVEVDIRRQCIAGIAKSSGHHVALKHGLADSESAIREAAIRGIDDSQIGLVFDCYEDADTAQRNAILQRALHLKIEPHAYNGSTQALVEQRHNLIETALHSQQPELVNCILKHGMTDELVAWQARALSILAESELNDELVMAILEGLSERLSTTHITTLLEQCVQSDYSRRMVALAGVINCLKANFEQLPNAVDILCELMTPRVDDTDNDLDIDYLSSANQQLDEVAGEPLSQAIDDAGAQTDTETKLSPPQSSQPIAVDFQATIDTSENSTLGKIIADAQDAENTEENVHDVPDDLKHKIERKRKHVKLGSEFTADIHVNIVAISAASDFNHPRITALLWQLCLSDVDAVRLSALKAIDQGTVHKTFDPWAVKDDYTDVLTVDRLLAETEIEWQVLWLKLLLNCPLSMDSSMQESAFFERLGDDLKVCFIAHDKGRYLSINKVLGLLENSKMAMRHEAARWLRDYAPERAFETLCPLLFDQGGADQTVFCDVLKNLDEQRYGTYLQGLLKDNNEQYLWRFAMENI